MRFALCKLLLRFSFVMQITAANIKKKDYILYRNEPHQVVTAEFYHPGKGRTVVRTRLKNIKSGKTVDQVFTSSEQLELLDVTATPCQYLYKSGENLVFMHEQTYEQYEVPSSLVGSVADFLKEGQSLYVLFLDGIAVGIRPPKSVTLTVIEAEEAAKGDTATSAKKSVTLETGVKVQVPLFIKKGQKINVNPETAEYQGREN